MSKIFDQKNNETVVHFANETDARSSTDKNFVFKLNDDYYGINKNFSENRFVNIEALKINELSCLNEEGKKLCEIDGFKNKCERQKQIVEIDEKIYSINKIYENQKEAFVAAYIMEFSDRNSLIIEEWKNLLKERKMLEIEKAIKVTNNLDTNEIDLKIEEKDEEIKNKCKEYDKNDLELIKARQKAKREFDNIFINNNQGKSFRDITCENKEKISKLDETIDLKELKIGEVIEIFINKKQCPECFLRNKYSSLETFTNEDLLNKLSNKELVYKYMIIIEKIKNKSEEEKSLEEKEISNFIKNLEQDRNLFICLHIDKQFDGKPKTVFRENYIKDLTDKLDSYIESQKQKVPELNLDFDGKLSELEESIIKNKQCPKKYRECLLDYYKTDVELENEKNKEDIDKDRLKIIFYQKKIAFLDKYLDKLDIYKNLDINKNIHNSEDFNNTLKKMDLEIELLYYDYSIYSKLMKIRDLYNSYPINKNEINRQRQYLFTKRKYYLELKKKLNENYMFQEIRNDNSLDLQQKNMN